MNAAPDAPNPPSQQQWQEMVARAIDAEALVWTRLYGSTWDLRGECPHCRHPQFSNVYDFDIWRQRGLRELIDKEPPTPLAAPPSGLQIECLGEGCGKAHSEDGGGCGAGFGYAIHCPLPEPGAGRD